LAGSFNGRAIAAEGDTGEAGIDGKSNAIPAEQIPPDGTRELTGNPFDIGKPGPNYYPSGYYVGSGAISGQSQPMSPQSPSLDPNHMISFLYPAKLGNDVISCTGQTVMLPSGSYKTIHILSAAASANSIDAPFKIAGAAGSQAVSVTIQSWNANPNSPGSSVGFSTVYHLNNGVVDTSAPSVIGQYAIPADPSKRINALVLPNDPRIKIFAITLER